MECNRKRWFTSIVLWGVVMNKRFFIHSITIYHKLNSDTFTKINFEQIYFRHNKKANMIDKRT